MRFKYKQKYIFVLLLFDLFSFRSKSQENNSGNPYIAWVNQFPAISEKKEKFVFFKSLFSLVTGKKDIQHRLVRPVAILAKNPHNFYVADQAQKTIFDVSEKNCEIVRSIKRKENYFTSLVGICKNKNEDILFTDSRLNKIFVLDGTSQKFRVLNDTLKLAQPTGIAYSDANNEVWVVETNAHRVSILSEKGEYLKSFGERGDSTTQFNFPTSIWIDKNGEAYIVDAMNSRVQIFDKNGKFVTKFGESGDRPGFFSRPKGIATDSYGNIYVVDALLHAVQIFDRDGNLLYCFGQLGREKEQFWMPSGIYIDNKNYIYIADSYNSRIQIYQLINGDSYEKNIKH